MKVETQGHGMIAVVVAHGPLTADELSDFRVALSSAVEAKAGRVVVDLEDVPYLDSGGIECLLAVCTEQGSPSARPRLAQLTDACREALELTGVLPRLVVFDTVENAIRSYQR